MFKIYKVVFTRGVAQLGRALGSGLRGRAFESRHPDFYLTDNSSIQPQIRRDDKVSDKQDIDSIIKMLDEKTEAGVSRIKIEIDENQQEQVLESRHYGRCDINSKDC